MKNYLLCFFYIISFISFGQSQQKIDSLKLLLNPNKNSESQILLNLQISKLIENKDRDSSKIFAKKAAQIALVINDHKLLVKSYLQQGILNYKQQKDDIALGFFNKIDSLYILDNEITETYFMSKIYRSEISKFTFTMEGVMQAKKYILQALALANKKENKKLINLAKYRLAEWHGFISQEVSPKQHLDSASSYIKEILPYYKSKKDYDFIAKLYHTLASIGEESKDYTLAEYYFNKRLQAIKKTSDSVRIGESYNSFGVLYRKLKKPNKGLAYLDSASAIFKKAGFSSIGRKKDLYKDYAYLYELKKDYKNAFEKMYQALLLKDTIYDNENERKAMELEKKFQTQKKEEQIALLKSQKKNQKYLFFFSVSLVTIIGLFFFILYKNRQKTARKLRELDKVKSNFFANISHEFRTPLTLISSPIQQQLAKKKLPESDRKGFNTIKRNTDRLMSLIDQLLAITKIESGSLKLNITQGNIIDFIETLTDSFSYSATRKDIEFKTHINHTSYKTWFDKDAIEKIVTNLLSNAIKYTPNNGTIICNAFVKKNKLHFEVKNTGEGIAPNNINQIFDRFYQSDRNSKGIGIGLALVKELISIYKGKISVKSTPNECTIFKAIIPVNKNSFNPINIVNEISDDTFNKITDYNDTSNNDTNLIFNEANEKPILLIVEDNAAVNNFIKDLFKDSYDILQAKNGKEGIKVALKYIPDMVISDIMMPVKDGIALCNTLKVDKRTSHIPIILLTAKAGEENEIKGIEVGADAYITKPFNNKLLKLKVEKLIESRKKLQTRYSQEVILKPADIAVNSIDELFLEHVQEVLDDNLIESSFNIKEFCKAVGMSRMQLHRKLKALTGLSTSEFICSQRLKLAANLLKTSNINISQVGYSVGFNNHAYFSKCFKEMYKCTPSDYAKKK